MSDRVFLITGASTGIGAATARAAAAAGYRVALLARSAEKLDALAAELGAERALALACDVREWDDQRRAVEQTLERWGRLDVAFANAGFGGRPDFQAESPEVWRDLVLTNVYGAALTVRACAPALAQQRGHLLLCSSVAGRVPLPGLYSATKWAVTALARGARIELRSQGVRVTSIEPGTVDTPFYDVMGVTLEDEMAAEELERPLGAEDVADAVMYAVGRPPHVAVNEILVRPLSQAE